MRLPSEYAAELRSTSDPAARERLTNELARSTRTEVVRSIRKVCTRHGAAADAEDGAQELVPKLVERIASGREPPRPGEESGYIERAALNKARDILKGKGIHKHRLYQPFSLDDEPSVEPLATTESEAERAQWLELVRETLPALGERYREVIEAHDFYGVPLNAIAEQWVAKGRAETLQKAKQNVQQAHSRGTKMLRELVRQRLANAEAKA